MSSASQAARADRNAQKARKCGKVLRIASDDEGNRIWGRASGDSQKYGATIFICEEEGVHSIHHNAEELENGILIDIQWGDSDLSQYKGVPNPLLASHPKLGKWLPQQKKRDKLVPMAPSKPISAEEW